MDTTLLTAAQLSLVPIVIGLVEVVKRTFRIDQFVPVASLLLGIGTAFLIPVEGSYGATVLSGIVIGLMACGLWSSTRSVLDI